MTDDDTSGSTRKPGGGPVCGPAGGPAGGPTGKQGARPAAVDAKEFVADAYSLLGQQQISDFYDKWADDYDRQMQDGLGYVSPENIALCLSRYTSTLDGAVLDVGCGTGLTGQAAKNLGFKCIDGLDLSPAMLDVARGTAVYRHLIAADLLQPLALNNDTYSAVISSGTFTHGHVGPDALDEILRVLKPGGLLACTIHFDLWVEAGFEDRLTDLCNRHVLECLERLAGKFYQEGEDEGWFCVYQKST